MPKYLSPDVRNILDEIKKLRQTIKDLKNKILTIKRNNLIVDVNSNTKSNKTKINKECFKIVFD
jgi:hypothetical protein